VLASWILFKSWNCTSDQIAGQEVGIQKDDREEAEASCCQFWQRNFSLVLKARPFWHCECGWIRICFLLPIMPQDFVLVKLSNSKLIFYLVFRLTLRLINRNLSALILCLDSQAQRSMKRGFCKDGKFFKWVISCEKIWLNFQFHFLSLLSFWFWYWNSHWSL